MSEIPVINTEFWEREVEILNRITSIRAEIEQEVEIGRAEIIYLLRRHVDIDKLNVELEAVRHERATADDGQSDIPTFPPPKPSSDLEEPLEESL